MKPVNQTLLKERHEKMLKYQEKIKPWIPTVRELKDLWGLHSTAHVSNILLTMWGEGMVIHRPDPLTGGKKNYYYAVKY